MGPLESYVKETLNLTSNLTKLSDKVAADPADYVSTDDDRWEYVFRMVTASNAILERLARAIDQLTEGEP